MRAIPDPEPAAPGGLLPSGTVTFAFTDGGERTERRAAIPSALLRSDALVRDSLTAHGGHVFKTIGDAFCAAFSRAEDALAAALAAQRAFATEDVCVADGLRVRIAIHTGTADERDGDYFGPAVNRVARLLAIGHAGQVLVSGVTSDLVHDALPTQTSLRDLGEHRLKDLSRPEQVYQLLAPDLVTEFPPLRSLDALPNNLPAALSSFIGRETEVAEITALLAGGRLVTLTGSGGVGKTRASLQVAANLLDGSGDGVWLIELAPLSSVDYIPSTVALALGFKLANEGDTIENLVRALKDKHALLIFDNCEHLVEVVARVIAAILRGCPMVKVLASSRQALGIGGEETYRLPSLDLTVQSDDNRLSANDAAQCAAIALFVDRARAADRRLTLTDENAPTIAEICRRLDGIPLAIELAAARVKILSPRQLRERLDERFRVLTGGGRDVVPRQQTLRGTIDWSHDLLDERERTLFRRLGVFVNGFTLEGAVAVGSGEEIDELGVFDVLASLVDQSLVLAEPAGDALRYRLLESTRVYAREKLIAANEGDACRARHLRYLRDHFLEARQRSEQTGRRAELDDCLAIELEDVRTAQDGASRGPDDRLLGGELLAAIATSWFELGLQNEGLSRIEAFRIALSQDEPLLLARLAVAVAGLAGNSGNKTRGTAAAIEAIAYARAAGDGPTLAEALDISSWNSTLAHELGEAEAALAEAEAISGLSAALRLRLLETRAVLSGQCGDHAAAARALEQLREKHRSLGNASAARVTSLNLAEVEHVRGQTQRAIAIVREVLPGFRAHRDHARLVNALANVAGYLAAANDVPGACASAREAIAHLASREPESSFVTNALEHLALALALGGDLRRAATLAGYVEPDEGGGAGKREFTEATTHERLTALLRERFAPADLAQLRAAGATLTPRAAVALALEEP